MSRLIVVSQVRTDYHIRICTNEWPNEMKHFWLFKIWFSWLTGVSFYSKFSPPEAFSCRLVTLIWLYEFYLNRSSNQIFSVYFLATSKSMPISRQKVYGSTLSSW